jgi:hypothetical protein
MLPRRSWTLGPAWFPSPREGVVVLEVIFFSVRMLLCGLKSGVLILELRVSFNPRGAVRKKEKLLRRTIRFIKKPREGVQIFTMFVVYINHAAG